MFTTFDSLIIILASAMVLMMANYLVNRRPETHKWSYMAANRNAGWIRVSFSIAAAWVWAPAFFVAAQQAYQNGWVGVFWFTVPNILSLILFSFFAHKIRKQMPNGITLSDYMRERYGVGVQRLYAFCMILLSLMSFAVQLLASGLVISYLTDLNYSVSTIVLATIAAIYSYRSGIKASFVTGAIKMISIIVIGLGVAYLVALNSGTVIEGLSGVNGNIDSLVSESGMAVFWSFGLPALLGILSGPFADQAFWQRAFSVRKRFVRRSFIVGALLYSITPITMSILGFAVAGAGMQIDNVQLVNLAAVETWLPVWVVKCFVAMIIIGLLSTLDSSLCAASSIVGNDFSSPHRSLRNARITIVVLAILGVGVANIPGLTIVGLFIIYGTLRSASLIPTVLTIGSRLSLDRRGVSAGIIGSLIVGLPISAYGNITGSVPFILGGSLATIVISGVATVTASWVLNRFSVLTKDRGVSNM